MNATPTNRPETPIPEPRQETDGWARSVRGNPYVVRAGVHATLCQSHNPEGGWLLFSTSHGRRNQTDLGPSSEALAKQRAEQFLNISRSMRQTRINRCRQLVQDGAKAPPDQRDAILNQAAALAAQITAELRSLPDGRHRSKDQELLSAVIAAGVAARNAPAML